MIHRLFTLASAFSLLLCAGTLALWVSSYWRDIGVAAQPPPHNTTCYMWESDCGAFTLSISNGTDDMRLIGEGWDLSLFYPPSRPDDHVFCPTWYSRLWFQHQSYFGPWRGEWTVPHWFVMLATGLLPFIRWRSGRVPSGCCRRCGYDLRATPDRCPECGAPVRRAKPSSA